MTKAEITFVGTPYVSTNARNRELFRQYLGLQLFGDPDALEAEWALHLASVVLLRRPRFPAKIPHVPAEMAAPADGRVVVPYAHDEQGNAVALQLSGTDTPNTLFTGGAGSGLTTVIRVAALEAARQGIDVRICSPKHVDVRGMRDWPNVTAASRVHEIVELITRTHDDMHSRYADIEAGRARASDYRRILLILDSLELTVMLVNDLWYASKEPGQQRQHPVLRKLDHIAAMCRGASINVAAAAFRDGSLVPGLRENLGHRVALGGASAAAARTMFPGAAERGFPPCPPGEGVTETGRSLTRIKVDWLADPGDWDALRPGEQQPLRNMLPPGTSWKGQMAPVGQVPA